MPEPTPPLTPEEQDRLAVLSFGYLDNLLGEDEIAELSALIVASDEARRLFTAYSQERFVLRDLLKSTHEEPDAATMLEGLAALEAQAGEVVPVDKTDELVRRDRAAKEKSRRDSLHIRRQSAEGQHNPLVIPQPIVWLGLAAALGLAAWIVIALSTPSTSPDPPSIADRQTPDETDPHAPAQPTKVAQLTGGVDVRWEDGHALASGAVLYSGQTLRLASGFVELTTESGATVVLEGPCELALLETGRFALAHGRVGVEDRNRDTQLTIQTPGGEVAHTQAAYGLSVGAAGDTSVVCYGGRVELFGTGGRAATPDPFGLAAGRAATALSGDLGMPTIARSTAADQSSFALSLDEAESPDFQYRRAVLTSGPVAYWTFDEDVTRGVTNIAHPGTHDLRAHGSPTLEPGGIAGGAARFDNLLPPYSYFETANSADDLLGGSEEFTIELWFKAERRERGLLLDLYPAEFSETPRHALVIELQDDTGSVTAAESPGWAAWSVRGLHRDPPAYDITGINLYSRETYRADRWHHVVFVKSGPTLLLYLDGQLQGQARDTGELTAGCRAILGIAANVHYPADTETRAFTGLLDEVALYDHALNPDEIADHWGTAQNPN